LQIQYLLARRSDLSTFVVHLTRQMEDGQSPGANLRSILSGQKIEARTAFGPANSKLQSSKDRQSQNCVSFSETPLEHLYCLVQKIPKRRFRLSSYGLAFTKMKARQLGVNPVWYVDITPGHDWLMKPINAVIEREIVRRKRFRKSPLAQIAPFIEQMGSGLGKSGYGYRKEFWWEREWRHRGDFHFSLSDVALGLAPERRIDTFEKFTDRLGRGILFVDPKWGLEKIIAHLARCKGRLTPFDE
jgi:Putative abortive phage resistance protein AbiGi, antitoxin